MRKVNRNWDDKPEVLTSASTLDEVEILAKSNGDNLNINPRIYKGTYIVDGKTKSKVREKLNEFYHQKCGYCETFCKAEIEHYRPKKSVKDEPIHKGYYWLAYEWSNLLPSCRYCNTEGGKGIHFTIAGTRTFLPSFLANGKLDKSKCLPNESPLKDEQAYLLHPEIDEPSSHLGFELNVDKKGVNIKNIDGNGITKGSETIRICNLNREYLRLDRLDYVGRNISNDMLYIFKLRKDNVIKSDLDLIEALRLKLMDYRSRLNDKIKHTLLWSYVLDSFNNFKTIIFPLIENDNQKIVIEAVFVREMS